MTLFVFHFPAILIVYFKEDLKSDWLFCFFSVASSVAGKKIQFKVKNGAIRE